MMNLAPLQDPDKTTALPALADPDAASVNNSVDTRQVPGFIEKLDMVASGVDRGVKNFTLAMLSKLPFGDRYQTAIKKVDAAATEQQEYNKKTYQGYYPQIGEVGGELLATAPLGGVLGKVVGKAVSLGAGGAIAPSVAGALGRVSPYLAKAANSALPTMLQTPTKYALAAAGGMGTTAAMESQRYDPANPGQLINTEAAGRVMSDPVSMGLSAGLPMLGAAAGSWTRKMKLQGETSDILGQGVISRNTMPEGAKKTLYQSVAGFMPALTGMGAQLKELKHIGDPVWGFISRFADQPGIKNSDEMYKIAGKTLHNRLKTVKQSVTDMWNQPFKTKVVQDTPAVLTEVNKALGIIDEVSQAIPKAELDKMYIKRTLSKIDTGIPVFDKAGNTMSAKGINKFTIEQVKNMQSHIGSAISKIKREGGGANEIIDELSTIHENLYTTMQQSLSKKDLADLVAAKTNSAALFDLKKVSPLVEKAMVSEYQSRKLLDKLISNKEPINKQRVLDEMLPAEHQQIAATKLADYWRGSNKSAAFHIDSFVTKVMNDPDLQHLSNNTSFKQLEGLNTYLKSVSQGNKVGWWRTAAVATAVGIPAALAGAGAPTVAGAMASLGAATFVANHPGLKRLFYALGKKLPENTKNMVIKAVGNHLSRAGYLIGTDGVLKNKKEEKE